MRKLLLGIVIGASGAYLLDPEQGTSRREALKEILRRRADTVLESGRGESQRESAADVSKVVGKAAPSRSNGRATATVAGETSGS